MNVIGTLGDSLNGIINLVGYVLPSVIFAFILVLVGLIFANILGRATRHILADLLKLDKVMEKSGLGHFLNDARISVSGFFAGIIRWSIILAFFVAASEVLGLNIFVTFLSQLIDYIPSILSAAIVIIVSVVAADILSRIVGSTSRSLDMNGNIASAITRYAVFIWGIVTALSQLRIDTSILTIAITGAIFALSLAFGLAFGIGGKETASRMLDKMKDHF